MEKSINISPTNTGKKPLPLRIIFILNAFKILLSLGFYTVFTLKDISIGNADRTIILYTALGYAAMFGFMVFFILKRKIWGLRASIILDFLVSIPATAIIGFIISIVSFALTFNKKVLAYFNAGTGESQS